MSVLGEQVSTLHGLAHELERSLSETLSATDRLSAEAFRTLQRLDYLRQSLKDIGAVMSHVGEKLSWTEGREVHLDSLHELVDMRESLEGLVPKKDNGAAVHDIWL
ncbi:hypothetical protein [Pseudooceanicola onchidii]|uniref:hypothetical protein n=1 Tax=Pseudooceanicola onchidii TaxID=2562279 RepID=UPI0010A9ADF3|nr:hypothetical protein [Pseudooceanicola onchidii]